MGFMEALLLTFIILKLIGVISWPWILVLSPLLPDVIIYVCLFTFGLSWWRRHRRNRVGLERMDWPRW